MRIGTGPTVARKEVSILTQTLDITGAPIIAVGHSRMCESAINAG
jgi:hypothetical protein